MQQKTEVCFELQNWLPVAKRGNEDTITLTVLQTNQDLSDCID